MRTTFYLSLICFQVIWVLSGVETVLLGDFVDSGSTQALFLSSDQTSDSPGDMDMLALIDADMGAVSEVKCYFADKFLLTDFAQINIDCWTSIKVCCYIWMKYIMLF